MKPYLLTTGLLFAAMSVVHLARLVDEWSRLGADRWFTVSVIAIVGLTGGLATWAWALFRR